MTDFSTQEFKMKPNNKSEIAAFLEEFQKRLNAVNKAAQKLTDIRSDASELEAAIAKLGEPNYKNREKFIELEATKGQLAACQGACEKQQAKIGDALVPLAEMLTKAGKYACGILEEVVANRMETVTSCLLQFSLDRRSARNAALQTDACRAAGRATTIYNDIATRVRLYSGLLRGAPETVAEYAQEEMPRVVAAAQKIEAVLAASVSKAPDLMQFIPFVPASATGTDEESEEEIPTRRAARKTDIGPDLSSEQVAETANQANDTKQATEAHGQ